MRTSKTVETTGVAERQNNASMSNCYATISARSSPVLPFILVITSNVAITTKCQQFALKKNAIRGNLHALPKEQIAPRFKRHLEM
uniref:Uncharacterized protein n=1 Tax=Arundo donax TaxID=35708 RepID=A0A0A9DTM5_ARUDO